MLKEANFPFDQTLTFYSASGSSITERPASFTVQDLNKVGVKVQIQQVDFPIPMENMLAGKDDMDAIVSDGASGPSESREMVHPESSVNFFQVGHTEMTDLIDEDTAQLTFEKRGPYFGPVSDHGKSPLRDGLSIQEKFIDCL